MKSTHSHRQIFRMLADARRPSGRQGHLGPLLLTAKDRKVAFRLFPRRQAKGNPAASRSISKMSPLLGHLLAGRCFPISGYEETSSLRGIPSEEATRPVLHPHVHRERLRTHPRTHHPASQVEIGA